MRTAHDELLKSLLQLLDVNLAVGSAGRTRIKDENWRYIETLAVKVARHAATAYLIGEKTIELHLPSAGQVKFIDWPSVQVLARACIEAYLTLYYVNVSPTDTDTAEFRFTSWMIAGLSTREGFPPIDDEGRAQLERDAAYLKRSRRRLARTSAFQGLTARQQKAALAGTGRWPVDTTLTKLTEEVFGETLAMTYPYFSGNVHSTALSAVQLSTVGSLEDSLGLMDGALLVICVALAQATQAYAEKFVYARKALSRHPGVKVNEFYANLVNVDWRTV